MNTIAGTRMLDSAFASMGVPVTYMRGEDALATAIPAKIGSTLFRADSNSGVTIRTESRDFILRMADLPPDFEPETTDEIIHDGHKYMVAAPNREPCWRWHSRRDHSQIRIHTVYVGT